VFLENASNLVSPETGLPADWSAAAPARCAARQATTAPADGPEWRSILFADLQGFSAVPEDALPGFCADFLDAVALVLERRRSEICFRNTWGDAVVLVTRSAAGAAEIAIGMQEALKAVYCPDRHGGHSSQMRIAVHHGPVYRVVDRIMERSCFIGSEIIRAARIEPVTPPGEIYVTGAFAAALRSNPPCLYATQYVGLTELPKGAGAEPLFRLFRQKVGLEGRGSEPSFF
jgi:class 3 adenylate cyclase